MGHLMARLFLEVVRRQPVILRADKRLEETPGLAGDDAEVAPLLFGERHLAHTTVLTDPPGEEGREKPDKKKATRRSQGVRASKIHQGGQGSGPAGAGHIVSRKFFKPAPSRWWAEAAVSHSSMCRRVTVKRTKVRMMASML